MAKPPMHNDNNRIFADDSDHVKVVLSLHKKNYDTRAIARATGLSEAQVRKIVNAKGVHR